MKPLNPFPPNTGHTSLVSAPTQFLTLLTEVQTLSWYLWKQKFPPQKWSRRVYLGTTANVRWLKTITWTQEGEEVKKVTMNVWIPSSSASSGPYLTLWDMCRGVSISSKMAPFTLDPLKFASWRSHPDRSQFWRGRWKSQLIELRQNSVQKFNSIQFAAGEKPATRQIIIFCTYMYIYTYVDGKWVLPHLQVSPCQRGSSEVAVF